MHAVNGGDGADAAFLMLALLLPLSALVARRLPLKTWAILGLAWAAILLTVMLAIGIGRRADLQAGWTQLTGLLRDDDQKVHGRAIQIRKAPDGHYWALASIDGVERRMLIDSGATTTSLSQATAEAAKLDLEQSPFPTTVETGNGPVIARTSSIRRLRLGPIEARDLHVVVAPEFGETDVLGMNFLSRLKSWRVENDVLVIEPKP